MDFDIVKTRPCGSGAMDEFYLYIKSLENRILRLEKFHQNSTGKNLLEPIIEEKKEEEELKNDDFIDEPLENNKIPHYRDLIIEDDDSEDEEIELGENVKNNKIASQREDAGTARATAPALPIRIGYYPEWATYHYKMEIEDIPFDDYDYICYAFMVVNPTTKDLEDANLKYPPSEPYHKHLPEGVLTPHDAVVFDRNIKKLKNKNVLISIGGWTLSFNFSKILRNYELRKRLITSINWYIREYGLAGVDIDWEYPNRAGRKQNNMDNQHSKQDGMYLRRFLKELRRKLGNDKIIMCAVGCNEEVMECYKGTEEYLDFVLIMNYDYSGKTWNKGEPMSDIKTDRKWLSKFEDITSFSKDKILVGIPGYARGWWKEGDKGVLNFGKSYNEDGMISLRDINDSGYPIKFDNERGFCYIEDMEWYYSFADLTEKERLANEYGGYGIWNLADLP